MDCADCRCSKLGVSDIVPRARSVRFAFAIGGAKGVTKGRATLMFVHSYISDIMAPITYLGNFRGIDLGPKRSGSVQVIVPCSSLKL